VQGPRNISKFRKVQPYERAGLPVAECWMCAARPIMVTGKPGSDRLFSHRMKEPDEGWHGRIM
jgi:hypothetical protein